MKFRPLTTLLLVVCLCTCSIATLPAQTAADTPPYGNATEKPLERVLVSGEVMHPCFISYHKGLTIGAVINICGGPTAQADLGRITCSRPDGDTEDYAMNLVDLQTKSKAAAIQIQPGDRLIVTRKQLYVYILGAVRFPGSINFRHGMTILEAISATITSGRATGLKADNALLTDQADLSQATITQSHGAAIKVDLDRLINEGDVTQNYILRPGDIVFIPQTKLQVFVYGEVAHPGEYYLAKKGKDRVLDLLQLAGGPTLDADLSKVTIAHTADNGAVSRVPIRLDLLFHGHPGADLQYNLRLKPMDVLYVSKQTHSTSFTYPPLQIILPLFLH